MVCDIKLADKNRKQILHSAEKCYPIPRKFQAETKQLANCYTSIPKQESTELSHQN